VFLHILAAFTLCGIFSTGICEEDCPEGFPCGLPVNLVRVINPAGDILHESRGDLGVTVRDLIDQISSCTSASFKLVDKDGNLLGMDELLMDLTSRNPTEAFTITVVFYANAWPICQFHFSNKFTTGSIDIKMKMCLAVQLDNRRPMFRLEPGSGSRVLEEYSPQKYQFVLDLTEQSISGDFICSEFPLSIDTTGIHILGGHIYSDIESDDLFRKFYPTIERACISGLLVNLDAIKTEARKHNLHTRRLTPRTGFDFDLIREKLEKTAYNEEVESRFEEAAKSRFTQWIFWLKIHRKDILARV
jgi:hypothetical protein